MKIVYFLLLFPVVLLAVAFVVAILAGLAHGTGKGLTRPRRRW